MAKKNKRSNKAGKAKSKDSFKAKKVDEKDLPGRADNKAEPSHTGSTSKDSRPEKNTNDPSWYIINETLAKQVANVPFSQFIGVNYEVQGNTKVGKQAAKGYSNNVGNTHASIPSVMMSTYVPWYGTAWKSVDSLSVTSRAFYQFVRHANSGARNYEAPDLMMYILAMDNIYLAIGEMKRVLRLVNTYYLKNRDIPEAILNMLNLDVVDLRENYISYVARLNILIARINTMAVPDAFNLFKRRAVLSSVILTDDVDAPTQVSFSQSVGWYIYRQINTNVSQSSSLELHGDFRRYSGEKLSDGNYKYKPAKFSQWLGSGETIADAVIGDEDMNIMSGDILKAYGDKIYKVAFLETGETQDFIYDINMLQQFKNTIYLDAKFDIFTDTVEFHTQKGDGTVVKSHFPVIAQNKGVILAKAVAKFPTQGSEWVKANPSVICEGGRTTLPISCVHEPTPGELIEWTRNTLWVDNYTGLITGGTELYSGLYLYYPKESLRWTAKSGSSYCVQYFQHSNTAGNWNITPFYVPGGSQVADSNIVGITVPTFQSGGDAVGIGCSNTAWAEAFVRGLDYGPQSMPFGHLMQYAARSRSLKRDMDGGAAKAGTPKDVQDMDLTPILGNCKTNSALLSGTNVKAMHDLAISALLFSDFIKV